MKFRTVIPAALVALTLTAGCGDSSPGPVDSGPPPMDQCSGSSDLAIIGALAEMADGGLPDAAVPDGGPYPVAYWNALVAYLLPCGQETCLLEILNEEGAEECISDCLDPTPAMGVSTGCIGCLGELLSCAGPTCAAICVGSDEAACLECNYQACGDELASCTGLSVPMP